MFGRKKEDVYPSCRKCDRTAAIGTNGLCLECFSAEFPNYIERDKQAERDYHRQVDPLTKDSVVSCDKCKHLIYKEYAVRGKSRVAQNRIEYVINGFKSSMDSGEIIQEVFYCPNCAPKSKPKKGKK